ncbi:chemotaxis protein CheA [Fervidibacillus halotolerans]|uniref:Chemotaxis protein CheA n=1 Tax=Fervidibacillus halotolerans TaxID=2980027 RepID=A0A9E8M149_9BACI|nr:chemotaxis protein CheA [Fervidibacillus halotolerans]WAA13583.1 chemotaxis protein CheA [Fervidibacillus halotolerans]
MEMNQYLEVFIEESREHLQNCNEQLLQLEKNPENITIVNEIFRSAHTLKGMSATMGYEDMANLTHQMENVLDGIRNGKFDVSSDLIDLIFIAIDQLEAMVESIASGGDGSADVQETVEKLKFFGTEGSLPPQSDSKKEKVTSDINETSSSLKLTYDTYEMTVLEQSFEQGYIAYELTVSLRPDCLLKSARVYMVFNVLEKLGDIIKSNPPVEQLEEEQFDLQFTMTVITNESKEDIVKKIMKVSEIDNVHVVPIQLEDLQNKQKSTGETHPKKEDTNQKKDTEPKEQVQQKNKRGNLHKTIRVNINRLDELMNLFEELVIDRGRLEQISKDINHPELTDTVEKMSRVSSNLQSIILTMRMVPVESVFNRFPKMVRQLSRELHKKINLQIIGQETELDRTVIDQIGDPIVHLLRNSIDHGIEMPEERRKKGKPEEGSIELKAYHSGNHVFIEIIDDGAGINREKVLEKAIRKGVVSEEKADRLTDKEVYDLIFSSGFSTAEKITDISGRGVGLDVVKNTIESLGGSITVQSERDKGTRFTIQLPLTLTIISVMLVEIKQEKYAIPLTSIIETAIIKRSEIQYAHEQPVIDFRGKVVPLIFLKDVFQVPGEELEDDFLSIVIVRKGEKLAALVVDSFIGQQEIVLKSLGNFLTNVFAISGATILGNGQVALIIDCNALIK